MPYCKLNYLTKDFQLKEETFHIQNLDCVSIEQDNGSFKSIDIINEDNLYTLTLAQVKNIIDCNDWNKEDLGFDSWRDKEASLDDFEDEELLDHVSQSSIRMHIRSEINNKAIRLFNYIPEKELLDYLESLGYNITKKETETETEKEVKV